MQTYHDLLARSGFGYVNVMTPRPGSDQPLPKISGVIKIDDWNWIVGFGVFVDDVDAAFWSQAWQFIGIGMGVLLLVMGGAVTLARQIYRQLGGEPAFAARIAVAVAGGDLSVEINAKYGMLASMAQMQRKLRQMVQCIKISEEQLHAAVQPLLLQMSQIEVASRETTDATASTAAAIEQLSVSVSMISEHARETEQCSSHIHALAEEGAGLVQQAKYEIRAGCHTDRFGILAHCHAE